MILFAVLTSLLFTTVGACKYNFEPWYDGKCFRSPSANSQYATAANICPNYGAHLPRIMNKAENDYFLQQIRSSRGSRGAWLDLRCDANRVVPCNHHVNYAINSTSGFWYAERPMGYQWVFCQQDASNNTDKCRGFHDANGRLKGDCFVVQWLSEWNTAERNCVADGGHLSSIHSDKENQFIIKTVGTTVDSIHIGLKTEACGATTADTKYQWTDGSDASFINFDKSATCNEKSKCVSIIVTPFLPATADSVGRWDTVECEDTPYVFPSVCVRHAIALDPVQAASCPADRVYNIGDYIVSPGFPSAGAPAQCSYHVNVPAGKNVRLRPLAFEANRCCDSLRISDQAGNSEEWTGIHAAPSAAFSSSLTLSWTATNGAGVVGFRLLVEDAESGTVTPKSSSSSPSPVAPTSATNAAPRLTSPSSAEPTTNSARYAPRTLIMLSILFTLHM